MREAEEKGEGQGRSLDEFARHEMVSEKERADHFVDKMFGNSEIAEDLKKSNYFMNPRARNFLLEQVGLIRNMLNSN